MRRREFITLLGGAAASWPLAARAAAGDAGGGVRRCRIIRCAPCRRVRKGLNEAGYFEGQNVTVEYHWLEGQ